MPPLYREISSSLQDAVRTGRLRSGTRLPSERDLARDLKVSRTTVVAAYQDLEACGLIRRQVGRGSFICARETSADGPFAWEGKFSERTTHANSASVAQFGPVVRGAKPMISFATALPALEVLPQDEIRDLAGANLRSTTGTTRLREAIAARMNVSVDCVLIVSGAQEAFHLIGRCLTDRKDNVVAEDPGSIGFRRALEGLGCETVAWPAPAWDTEVLEHTILRYKPRLVYTNGIFHNPTTRSMSRETRVDLIELATRYRVPIVEDIAFADLAFKPAPMRTLAQIEPNVVIQVGSFTPTLGPALRIGFVIAPPAVVNQLAIEKERTTAPTSGLTQAIVADMIRCGLYDRHLDNLRREHAARLTALLDSIRRRLTPDDVRFTVPEGGSFLWMRLARDVSAEALHRRAREVGVDFTPGPGSHLRIGFAGVPVAQIDEGVRRLAMAIERVDAVEVTDVRELAS